ncbi:unnamed protein product [Musa acuminata var. zebrina]
MSVQWMPTWICWAVTWGWIAYTSALVGWHPSVSARHPDMDLAGRERHLAGRERRSIHGDVPALTTRWSLTRGDVPFWLAIGMRCFPVS